MAFLETITHRGRLQRRRRKAYEQLGMTFYEQCRSVPSDPASEAFAPLIETIHDLEDQIDALDRRPTTNTRHCEEPHLGDEAIPAAPQRPPQCASPCRCGSPLRPGARFCGVCGKPVAAAAPEPPARETPAVRCGCGHEFRKPASFCPACGRAFPAYESKTAIMDPGQEPKRIPTGVTVLEQKKGLD